MQSDRWEFLVIFRHYIGYLFLVLSVSYLNGFSVESRPVSSSLKVSVIIPCHYKHAEYLPSLLKMFAEQTILPQEVIISLSECAKVDEYIIKTITSTAYPFYLHLLTFKEPVSTGANRSYACSQAKGDVFVCQDADDLPHPQRIEVIKFFFENYEVDHLMHAWSPSLEDLPSVVDLNQLDWFHLPEYTNILGSGIYANGPAALSRRVFDLIQWDSDFRLGEDVAFNKKVYKYFPNTIVVKVPLYVYRHELSSQKYNDLD